MYEPKIIRCGPNGNRSHPWALDGELLGVDATKLGPEGVQRVALAVAAKARTETIKEFEARLLNKMPAIPLGKLVNAPMLRFAREVLAEMKEETAGVHAAEG